MDKNNVPKGWGGIVSPFEAMKQFEKPKSFTITPSKSWQERERERVAEFTKERRLKEEYEARVKEQKEAQRKYWEEKNKKRREAEAVQHKRWEEELARLDAKKKEDSKELEKARRSHGTAYSGLLGRAVWAIRNMIGDGLNDATEVNAQSQLGKIDMSEANVYQAEAHKKMLEYQNQRDLLKEAQNSLLFDLTEGGQPAISDRNAELSKRWQSYQQTIDALDKQMQDPVLKGLDDAYKVQYMEDKHNFFQRGWDHLASAANFAVTGDGNYYNSRLQQQYDDTHKNDLGDLNNVASGQNETDDVIATERKKQQKYREDYEYALKWNDIYKKTYNVPEAYKKLKQDYQNDRINSVGYWLYVMPGMIGSSNSSLEQVKGNVIQAAGVGIGLAAAPATGGASLAVGANIGTLASVPFQLKGGLDENYAEIDERRTENIKSQLKDSLASSKNAYTDAINDLKKQSIEYWKKQGRSDEWINERFNGDPETSETNVIKDLQAGISTSNDPRVIEAMIESTAGLKAQFQADNVRTMGESAVLIPLQFMRGTKFVGGERLKNAAEVRIKNGMSKVGINKAKSTVTADAEGRVTASVAGEVTEKVTDAVKERTLKRAAKRGYKVGEAVGESAGFGYFGSKITGAAGAAANSTLYVTRNMLPKGAQQAMNSVEIALTKKYNALHELIKSSEKAYIAGRYGLHVAKNGIVGAFSEGAEEAAQYLNSKTDFASKYGWNGVGLENLILNDVLQGGRIAQAMLAKVGIGDSPLVNDMEFWSNYQGGVALGAGHPVIMQIPGAIKGTVQQIKTNEALKSSNMFNREAMKNSRSYYAEIARQASYGRGQAAIQSLKDILQTDERSDNPMFTAEERADMIRRASEVVALSNNGRIKDHLQSMGIQKGSDKYSVAIADLQMLYESRKANKEQSDEVNAALSKLYGSKEYQDELDRLVEMATVDSLENARRISEQRVKAANDAEAAERKAAEEAGEDTSTAEFVDRIERIRNEAKARVSENIKNNVRKNTFEITRAANRVRALLGLKAQDNTIEDFFGILGSKFGLNVQRPDAKRITSSIDSQLKQAKQTLKKFYPELNLDVSDGDLLKQLDLLGDVVTLNNEEAVRLETNAAILAADRSILNQRMLDFEKPVNNGYSRRIDKIMEVEDQNAKINWMLNDVFNGDAVTKLEEDLRQERTDEILKLMKELAEKKKTESTNKPASETPVKKSRAAKQSNLAKNKAEYLRKKQRARDAYKRRKDKYKNWKRGNASAFLIPGLDNLIVNTGNKFIELAQTGVYKFEQFIQDMQETFDGEDFTQILPKLKQLYIKHIIKAEVLNPESLENYSTAEEVTNFVIGEAKQSYIVPELSKNPTFAFIQNAFLNMESSKIQELSNYVDTFVIEEDGSVNIYTNKADLRDDDLIQQDIQKLILANTSDDLFREAVKEVARGVDGFPIDLYVLYRNVDGVEGAIARARQQIPLSENASIKYGKDLRDAVIHVLLGDDDYINGKPLWYDDQQKQAFLDYVHNLKQSWTEAGYEILNTSENIYGTVNGERISTQVDVVLINKKGLIVLFDVITSYKSFVPNFDKYPTAVAKYTRRERSQSLLDQAEGIINETFGIPVVEEVAIGFRNNRSEHIVGMPDGYIKMNPKSGISVEDNTELSEYKQKTEALVSKINEAIVSYNGVALSLNEYVPVQAIDTIEAVECLTQQEYTDYIQQLNEKYQDVLNQLQLALTALQDYRSQDEYMYVPVPEEPLPDAFFNEEYLENDLRQKVDNLNELLLTIENVRATEKFERKNVVKLLGAVFEAQKALDEALFYGIPAERLEAAIEAIADAMDKLANNKDNFGEMAWFVQKWWLNDFSNAARPYTGYLNMISSWYKVLQDRGFDDILDSHPALEMWYSNLINTYFTKLLDNFETYLRDNDSRIDLTQKQTANAWINAGRGLVDSFNSQWGIIPDGEYGEPAANEIEAANRISTVWNEKYGKSSAHTFAIDQMQNSTKQYWHISRFPDFLEKTSVTLSLDRDGNVRAYVEYNGNYYEDPNTHLPVKTDNPKKQYQWMTFITDVSKLKNPSEEEVERIKRMNRGNRKFIAKVKSILQLLDKPEYKDYKLDFTLSTNKGSINYDNNAHYVSEFLFADQQNQMNLYTVTLDEKNHMGILRTIINRTTGRPRYDVVAGPRLSLPIADRFDDRFIKDNIQIASGMIVYFYDYGDGNRIGVPIMMTSIGQQSAVSLVNLLELLSLGIRYTQEGYDIQTLIKQRLYFNDGTKVMSPFNNQNNLVSIEGRGIIRIGDKQYNLATQKQDLINRIATMGNVVDGNRISTNMNDSSDPVMSIVRQQFASTDVDTVTLPNGLIISREDITHREPGQVGSTWLGYFMRNGLLATRAFGKSYRLLNIDNVRAVDTSVQHTPEAAAQQQLQAATQARTRDLNDLRRRARSGLHMQVREEDLVERSGGEIESFRQKAIKFFDSVFGSHEDLDLNSVDGKYIELESHTPNVVGLCADNIIKLSMYAPESAIYHEAFHKLVELMIPDSLRESIYTAYRSWFRWNASDRQVAEGITDVFTDWMDRKQAVIKAHKYHKLFPIFKKIAFQAGLLFKIGPLAYMRIMSLSRGFVKGEYKSLNNKISQAKRDRFKELFGEGLYYEVENNKTHVKANFDYIRDSSYLQAMVESLSFYILDSFNAEDIDFTPESIDSINDTTLNRIPQSVINKLCGYDENGVSLPKDEIYDKHLAYREIFKTDTRKIPIVTKVPVTEVIGRGKNGKLIYRTTNKKQTIFVNEKYYPNFAAIQDRVTQHISSIILVEEGRLKLLDYDEDENMQRQNIDKFDKASQEFNKLDGVTPRVKLFFATVPYLRTDGQYDCDRNVFHSPTYMPLENVYNIIVNELNDVTTLEELKTALEKKAADSWMYKYISNKFNSLYDRIYTKDENGYITKVDYDKEAFAIQILMAVRSQKMDFYIAKSTKQDEGKSVEIKQSSTERDSKMLSRQWTQILQSGQVAVLSRTRDVDGNYKFANGVGPNVFRDVVSFFTQLTDGLRGASAEFVVDGQTYNKETVEGIKYIKEDVVATLNKIGILINEDIFDYMLLHNSKYNSLEADGIYKWLTDPDRDYSIEAFYRLLEGFTYGDKPNQKAIDKGYSDNGFVKELANWVGKYNRVTTQQSAYALGGKKLYSITQNDSLSEVISNLNTNNQTNRTVQTLTGFGFNLRNVRGIYQGSIALRTLMEEGNLNLEQKVYIGLKTDNYGDIGNDYSESPTVDDYIAKLTMLQDGYMILPTLADKSTWKFLSGLNIPGMKFIKGADGTLKIENMPKIRFIGNEPYLVPSDNVLNQFIEYAFCERQAIQECMEDLGYKDIPGYVLQDREPLSDEQKIKNYHTVHKQKDAKGKTFTVEPNGTRFWSMTEIVVLENGKEVTYNLNDPNKSSTELLKLANEKFFDKSIEDQKDIIARTLAVQNRLEVKTAIDLGLIQTFNNTITNPADGKAISFGEDSFANLKNINLNNDLITALANELIKQIPGWASYEKSTKKIGNSGKFGNQLYNERFDLCRSLAIAAILGDVTNRSIISSQESIRLFIGHPGQFKVLYDKENGRIKDSTFDLQKRIGGLVSTGEDNVLDIPNIPKEYTCAELNDYEIGSGAQVMSKLNDLFILSAVRERYALILEELGDPDAWTKPYDMSVEEIKEAVKDSSFARDISDTENNAKTFGDTYRSKINVADGAAYITADMCKNMLRMRGAYSDAVEKAFNILTADETKYTWPQRQDAYATIYEAVNIVTTKYTAYGFREHTSNGDKVSDVAVAYYNKFALFPLFPSIATGKMSDLYDKMLNESVDMLLMTSAVKLGSQGAVDYDGTQVNKPFNKYTQQFSYLRRQLNTDPEEGENINAGTQMIKIALQNLRLGRSYTTPDGGTVTGQELLDRFMEDIKKLSEIGEDELDEKFMTDGMLDEEKLSKYLISELSSRNANQTTIDALQIVTEPDGSKHMKSPISATPDATWIESILISTINKAIVDIKTPGGSFVQRSVFAMEGSSTKGGSIQSDKDMSPKINGGKRLEMINDKGSMDAVISIDYFYKLFPFLKKMTPQKARQWLFENDIIGQNANANTVAYRIPTQAQSSIHALRFVDVVFGTKDTIILPEEFTKITGSDKHINVRTLKNLFNCWKPLTFRRGQSAAKTLRYYVSRVRFND